jgi:hypothetical protein
MSPEMIRIVAGIVAVFLALLVARDASRRGMNAVGWFLGVLFLLLIALPLYFILRKPLLPQYQSQLPQRQTPSAPVFAAATAASIKPMFCLNCGAEIGPTSRFCASCGAKCVVTKPMPPTKSNRKVWVSVAGAFIGLILLTAIIRNTSSTAPAGQTTNPSGPDSRAQSSSSETTSSQPSTSSDQLATPASSSSAVESLSSMYGPPQSRKRKTKERQLVCANVFGLEWSQ